MGSRVALLLAASGMAVGMLALAVCLVDLLSSYADKSEASAVLAVARAARAEHVVPDGQQHPIGRSAPTAFFAEETESTDGLPANAGLFTALLLGFLFGPAAGRLNSAASAPPGPRLSRPTSCRFYSVVCLLQRRSFSTLSGAFRL